MTPEQLAEIRAAVMPQEPVFWLRELIEAAERMSRVVEAARALSEGGYDKEWLQVELNDALDEVTKQEGAS